jgi:hypothetical protein
MTGCAQVSVGREQAGGCGIRLCLRQSERKTGQNEHQPLGRAKDMTHGKIKPRCDPADNAPFDPNLDDKAAREENL